MKKKETKIIIIKYILLICIDSCQNNRYTLKNDAFPEREYYSIFILKDG